MKFVWKDEHKTAFDILKISLLNSKALAFPQYGLPFYLGVDTYSKGCGYMLYQKHPSNSGDETFCVVRFGSKSLSHYHGPTKLKLLGVVTSILDCASYLQGRKFYVDCDHQALKPYFQKSLKGAIYERWLAILQEFNFEILYKPAETMIVCDSLSRVRPIHFVDFEESSPNENDPYFPYVPKPVHKICLFYGSSLQEIICTDQPPAQQSVNHVLIQPSSLHSLQDCDLAYDGDTDLPSVKRSKIKRKSAVCGKYKIIFQRPQLLSTHNIWALLRA